VSETESAEAIRHTALESAHAEAGATFTTFAGWRLPLRFAGELAEHHAVRASAGAFDISHMGQITLSGAQASATLASLIVSDVEELGAGRARYTMMCNERGGVVDDLIVYRLGAAEVLVIANASNTQAVLERLVDGGRRRGVDVVDRTADWSLLSLQGPQAIEILGRLVPQPADLPKRFHIAELPVAGVRALVARTGYTGEDGFEVSIDRADTTVVWQALLAGGAVPIGLAARDSLRLEAGLPLYGHELCADRSPLDSGFGRVIDFDHAFVGREPILAMEQAGEGETLVGLACSGKRSPRPEYTVRTLDGRDVGVVTSGGPSPTLGVPIALAYVARAVAPVGTELVIDIRNRPESATVVALPFLRSLPRADLR